MAENRMKKRVERLEQQVEYLAKKIDASAAKPVSDVLAEWDISEMTEADIKGISKGMRDALTPTQTKILEALRELIPEDQAEIVVRAIIAGKIPSVYISTNFSNMMTNFPA